MRRDRLAGFLLELPHLRARRLAHLLTDGLFQRFETTFDGLLEHSQLVGGSGGPVLLFVHLLPRFRHHVLNLPLDRFDRDLDHLVGTLVQGGQPLVGRGNQTAQLFSLAGGGLLGLIDQRPELFAALLHVVLE